MRRPKTADYMTRDAARGWVARLASGDLTHEEMATFKGWLAADASHQSMFDRERQRWRAYEALRAEFDARSATADPVRRPIMPRLAAGLLAACLVLAAVLADPYTMLRADHATSVGEVCEVSLPDGSVAELNSDSAIAVDFNDQERGVTLLKGEAWFQVRKNAELPFRVRSHEGVTEAVGTAFSVRDDQESVAVSVTEGVVAVTAAQSAASTSLSQPVHVAYGQTIEYATNGDISQSLPFDADETLAWRDGRVMIDDLSLSAAIAQLDRYRPGRILLLDDAAAGRRVSGIFSIDKIDQGLEGLAHAHGLTVTRLTPYLLLIH